MKTLLNGLLALGLTIQCFAQSTTMTVQLDEVELAPSKNLNYTNLVASNENYHRITTLETKVGAFDITKTSAFKNNYDTYNVLFKNFDGQIVANYDDTGKLINVFEKFENTPLPEKVRAEIRKQYPDWKINSSVYRVSYFSNRGDVKKVYNLQIINQNKKMNLKISPDGTILNQKIK